jgi:ADP-ribose pyrophosphatase YjhB (NUDIX family)
MTETSPQWLAWAREIHALAHTGHHYARNPFERDRAVRLQEIAADMIAGHSNLSSQEVLLWFGAQPGYVTPKVDVRAAVFDQGRILMVRELMDDAWTLPGGWADVGETPHFAVEREVLEESGLRVRATRLVGVYDANRIEGSMTLFHAYKLVFLCELLSGELGGSVETSEAGFFPLEELPQPFSLHRTTPRHISDAIAAYHDPSLQAVFD